MYRASLKKWLTGRAAATLWISTQKLPEHK
jgi:hypothetical protein